MKNIIFLCVTFLLLASCGGEENTRPTQTNVDTKKQETMQENNFVYADLSAYDVEKAKEFYGNVFGWEYFSEDGEYYVAFSGDKVVSGLYEMPERFKTIKMPSFWMSYIQVESVEATVEKA